MRVYAAGDDGASSTLEWIMQTDLKVSRYDDWETAA